jgi:hypothetical protein
VSLILFYKLANPVELLTAEASTSLQPNGVEPELRHILITLDVYVRGLIAITGIEEEPVRPDP